MEIPPNHQEMEDLLLNIRSVIATREIDRGYTALQTLWFFEYPLSYDKNVFRDTIKCWISVCKSN